MRNPAVSKPIGGDLKFLLLSAALFFYIYPVTLVGSGLPLWTISYAIFCLLWILTPFRISLRVFAGNHFVMLLFLSFYSGLVTSITYVEDYAFSIQIAKVAVVYVATGVLVGLICVKNYQQACFDVFLKSFVLCVVVQSIFILLSVVSIDFRRILDAVIVATGNTNYLESFRVRGFSSAGGASLSLIQATGVLAALYVYRINGRFAYLVSAFCVWLPTFAVGRTGFFIAGAFLAAHFFIPKVKARVEKRGSRWMFPLALAVGALLLLIGNYDYEGLERAYDYTLPWLFEFFINAKDGNYSTATTSELARMLTVPDKLTHFVFGTGAFDSDALGYERSDSGYVRTLYASGVVGCLIFYPIIVGKFIKLIRSSEGIELKAFLLVVLFTGMLVEIKEPFLYQNYFGKFIFILFGIGAAKASMRRSEAGVRVRSDVLT